MATVSKNSAYPATVKAGIPRLLPCPQSWTQAPIGAFVKVMKRRVKMNEEATYDLITVKRARGGAVKRETKYGREISVKSQYKVQKGDFLISKRQIVHGACAIVPSELEDSIVSNEYSVLETQPNLEIDFLKYLSNSGYFQRTCFHSSIGVHIEKMIFKLDNWLKWKFNIPPVCEQRKIVDILSTWDHAIKAIEKLIENSECQKKALMQQLLTGKRRLSGFTNDWKLVKFNDVLKIDIGGTPSRNRSEYWDEEKRTNNRWVSIRDLKKTRITQTKEHLTDLGTQNCNANLIPAETVIMSFKLTIGKAAILANASYTNEAIAALTPKQPDELLRDYLFHSLNVVNFDKEIDQAVKGKTLNKAKLKRLELWLPEYAEQTAIAERINAANKSINKERDLLNRIRAEKSALMQQLLTGKRRVKIDEEIAA